MCAFGPLDVSFADLPCANFRQVLNNYVNVRSGLALFKEPYQPFFLFLAFRLDRVQALCEIPHFARLSLAMMLRSTVRVLVPLRVSLLMLVTFRCTLSRASCATGSDTRMPSYDSSQGPGGHESVEMSFTFAGEQ